MSNVFLTALKNQGRALGAVVMAEYAMRVSRRSLGLIEELLSLGFIGGGMAVLRVASGAPTHHGMPILPFMLSGLILFWLFRSTMFRVAQFKTAKSSFKSNPRVTELDVLFARALLNTCFYTILAFTIFIILNIVGMSPAIKSTGNLLLLYILSGLFSFGIGLCLGALFLVIPFMRVVFQGLMMALMWVSGVMFIWSEVPYMVREPFRYNPIFQMMELTRTAYFSSYETPVGSWSFLLGVVFVTLAIGLMLERVSRRRAEAAVFRRGGNEDFEEDLA